MTVRRRVEAPVDRVWAIATDLPGASDVLSNVVRVEMLSAGPFAVGTRWRETRRMFGKEATEEMWVTACDPSRAYTVESESHGARYVSTFAFTPTDGATDVSLTFGAQPRGRVQRVVAGVFGGVMARSVARQLEHDLADIATAAERQPES